MEARYLTVDLEIQSDSDLTPLVNFLDDKVFFLWKEISSNKSTIGLETNLHNSTGPEEDILELLHLFETIPNESKVLWDNCSKKIMDIGYECGSIENPINSFISSEVVQRVARLGCAINIRIYPCVERPEKGHAVGV